MNRTVLAVTVAVLAVAVWLLRYDIQVFPGSEVRAGYQLDRWTGEVRYLDVDVYGRVMPVEGP